jgi:hypothetical protein
MVKLDRFLIELNENCLVYFPGDKICGSVYIKLNERLKYNSIFMTINGKAKIYWYFFS